MWVKDAALIRRAREQRRYSQRDLAFLVRRTQAAIHAVEAGKLRSISDDFALAIATRLDVPWEVLFSTDAKDGPDGVGMTDELRAGVFPAEAEDDPEVASR
ncbi:helix-turn-helix transcriptional regulator [Xylanimonas protaetiae]|uniref:XRE family transcriptional regulator n=1 Tax=Xylanimonas protaetiae TaxID=2509457 RepID=A0A4P6F684_9MICO|nr:helix-turn-helix transcriptional regulator [Xylanimonas protaetiae]QAY69809.1 XRE family transcriptional regulator [Xylanimonas protaetiae]